MEDEFPIRKNVFQETVSYTGSSDFIQSAGQYYRDVLLYMEFSHAHLGMGVWFPVRYFNAAMNKILSSLEFA